MAFLINMPDSIQCAQKSHEAKGLIKDEKPHHDADNRQRNRQPDDGGHAQGIKEADHDQDHEEDKGGQGAGQSGLGVAELVLAPPLHRVAPRERHGLDLGTDAVEKCAGQAPA